MTRLRAGLLLAGALCALWSARASALVRYDFEERFFTDRPHTVADRCMVERDSVFHMFYTQGPVGSFSPSLQTSFGHATTRDFVHWTILPEVLPTAPGTWESQAHWAPMILERPAGTYNMFYTGVDSNGVQQIGLATSTDLATWTPSPANPIYHPDTAWASWSPFVYSNCRDPFVWVDGDSVRMIATTVTQYGQGALSLAASVDMTTWIDQGPLAQMPSGPTSWHQLEAPMLTQFGGSYQLYYGETDKQGIRWVASPTLRGPWDLSSPGLLDYGASGELIAVGDSLFFHRHSSWADFDTTRSAVRFDPVTLTGSVPIVVSDRLLPKAWTLTGTAFASQPVFGDNPHARGGAPANAVGNGWIGTGENYPGPLVGGQPGGTQSNTLTGDMTSPAFVVAGDSLTLLVGGGNKPDSAYVALCDACTDSLLRSATGANAETLQPTSWSIAALRGQRAYLRIADHATGTWGHINCDEIREVASQSPAVATPTLTLLAPLGGSTITVNSPATIRWQLLNADPGTTVSVYLSQDAGVTYPRLLGTANPGDTAFVWQVDIPPTGSVRFKIIGRLPIGITCCDHDSLNVTVQAISIQNVSVCNVTDTTALIFWTTVAQADGSVDIGPTTALGTTYVQSIGTSTTMHAVVVHNLLAQHMYYFRIRSQGETDDNGGTFYTFTTAQKVTGQIYRLRGTVTQNGVGVPNVAALATLNRGGVKAYPLFAQSTSTGSWSIDLGGARDPITGVALRAQAGDSVRVQFFQSPVETQLIDPVIISGVTPQPLGTSELVTGITELPAGEPSTSVLGDVQVAPLPARDGRVTVRFRLTQRAALSARILDVRGREVRRLALAQMTDAGPRAWQWDGRDAAGRPAPAGVYFADLRAGADRARARIVLLR